MLYIVIQQPKNKYRQGLSCVFEVIEAETKSKALKKFKNMNEGQVNIDYAAPIAKFLEIDKPYMI